MRFLNTLTIKYNEAFSSAECSIMDNESLLRNFENDPLVKQGGGDKNLLYEILKRKLYDVEKIGNFGYRLVQEAFIRLFCNNEYDLITHYLHNGAEDIIFDIMQTKGKDFLTHNHLKFLVELEPTYYKTLVEMFPDAMDDEDFDDYKRSNKADLWGLQKESVITDNDINNFREKIHSAINKYDANEGLNAILDYIVMTSNFLTYFPPEISFNSHHGEIKCKQFEYRIEMIRYRAEGLTNITFEIWQQREYYYGEGPAIDEDMIFKYKTVEKIFEELKYYCDWYSNNTPDISIKWFEYFNRADDVNKVNILNYFKRLDKYHKEFIIFVNIPDKIKNNFIDFIKANSDYLRSDKVGLWSLEQEKLSESKTIDVTPMGEDIEKMINELSINYANEKVKLAWYDGLPNNPTPVEIESTEKEKFFKKLLEIQYLQRAKKDFAAEDSEYYVYKDFSVVFDKYDNENSDNEETIIWLIELSVEDLIQEKQDELIKMIEDEPSYINNEFLPIINIDFLPDYLKRGKSSGLFGLQKESLLKPISLSAQEKYAEWDNKLNENPDALFLNNIEYLSFKDDDAKPFMWFQGKCYIGDYEEIHTTLSDKIGAVGYPLKDLTYWKGRYWEDRKLLAFWDEPPLNSWVDAISQLEKASGLKIWDNKWKVEIHTSHPDFRKYSIDYSNTSHGDTKLIPVEHYDYSKINIKKSKPLEWRQLMYSESKGVEEWLKSPTYLTNKLIDLCMPEFQKNENGEVDIKIF